MKKAMFFKSIIPLLVFLIVAFFLWRGLNLNPHILPSPFIGKVVPEFNEHELYHPNAIISNQNFHGKVTLLNVFASWCISCRVEHPMLMTINEEHRVPIYGLDYKDSRKKVMSWLSKDGDPYKRVIFDPKGIVGINLGVYGTPETFVIDRKGVIRYKYIGPITPQVWQDDLWPQIRKARG